MFTEHGIYPALAFVLAAVLIGYRYRSERNMPCRAYVRYQYAAYGLLWLTVGALLIFDWLQVRVPFLASAFTLGVAGSLVLAERSYYRLVVYLRSGGRDGYDGRPLWMYRFYLWSLRILIPFVVLAAVMMPFLPYEKAFG